MKSNFQLSIFQVASTIIKRYHKRSRNNNNKFKNEKKLEKINKFGYKLDIKVHTYGILLYYWLPIGTYDKKFGNLNQISFII
jgi:hypothetical protein